MSVYLDTSSLVKFFVDEKGSDEVRRLIAETAALVTSAVTYAEARSAFARMRRDETLSSEQFAAIKAQFEENWGKYLTVEPTDDLIREAGEFAERYRLRGCDSVHLASYAASARLMGVDDVAFSSFDVSLDKAARALVSRLAGRKPSWINEVKEGESN
jgi:predicted nucleic acid-binding protein